MGYQAQQQNAANVQATNATNAANAEQARALDQNNITRRQTQEVDSANSKLFSSRVGALRQTASAELVGADRGVAGNSLNAIVADYMSQAGREDAATIRNNSMVMNELQSEREQANMRARARATPQPTNEPSLIGLGLGIAGAGLGAYSDYKKFDRARN